MHTNVLIKKEPNENVMDVSAPKSTSKDKLDVIQLYEREKRKQILLLEGCEKRNQRMHSCFAKNITKFFEDYIAMRDVMVYVAHRVGQKRLKGKSCPAIVCIILDDSKRVIVLDNKRVYLKGTNFFLSFWMVARCT